MTNFSDDSPPRAINHAKITSIWLVCQYETVASMATRILGAKKKPSHQSNPPNSIEPTNNPETAKVKRGNSAMEKRKNHPCFEKKSILPKVISVKLYSIVDAPVMAKKIKRIFKIVFIYFSQLAILTLVTEQITFLLTLQSTLSKRDTIRN